MSHRLILKDLREEFVEGFVMFLEALLGEKGNKQNEYCLFGMIKIRGGLTLLFWSPSECSRLSSVIIALLEDKRVIGSPFTFPLRL